DDPLRAGTHVLAEEPLDGAPPQAHGTREVLDPDDVAVGGDAPDDAVDELDRRVRCRLQLAQELLESPHHRRLLGLAEDRALDRPALQAERLAEAELGVHQLPGRPPVEGAEGNRIGLPGGCVPGRSTPRVPHSAEPRVSVRKIAATCPGRPVIAVIAASVPDPSRRVKLVMSRFFNPAAAAGARLARGGLPA